MLLHLTLIPNQVWGKLCYFFIRNIHILNPGSTFVLPWVKGRLGMITPLSDHPVPPDVETEPYQGGKHHVPMGTVNE